MTIKLHAIKTVQSFIQCIVQTTVKQSYPLNLATIKQSHCFLTINVQIFIPLNKHNSLFHVIFSPLMRVLVICITSTLFSIT